MTIAAGTSLDSLPQHVCWRNGNEVLVAARNQQWGDAVTYDEGGWKSSPLPKHEMWGGWIDRLIEMMCFERSIPLGTLGSTTFRNQMKQKGPRTGRMLLHPKP